MERKFKHKITNKVIKIGGKTGLSCQTLIGNSDLILGDIIKGEDWEEVIEKDYEILSFIDIFGNIFKKDSQTNIFCEIDGNAPFFKENYLLNNSKIKIHSIKRLSDGEIFTIGDKCTSGKASGVITKIWFCDNGELRINSDGNYCMNIKGIQHCKEPLFTTEDGVDIFEGNKFYRVTKDFIFWDISAEVSKEYHYKYLSEIGIKHFSTKEKAEEYILMNKPCLSLQEVLNVLQLPLYKNHTNKKYIEELKQITNTKING